MQLQGANKDSAVALATGDLDSPAISDKERKLLAFAKIVTEGAYRTTKGDVQKLRDAGWGEEQIAEAVYVVAMFAFFNRVADAFGLQDPDYGDDGPPREDRE